MKLSDQVLKDNMKVLDIKLTNTKCMIVHQDAKFYKARDLRNNVLHKADMKLTNKELKDSIATLDNMLSTRHPSIRAS